MVQAALLPRVGAPIASGGGQITQEWRDFFLRLASSTDSAQLAAELRALADRVAALEDSGDDLSALIVGLGSVRVYGTLESGKVEIRLDNDEQAPGATFVYGTGPTGVRGWHRLYDAHEAGTGLEITDSGYVVLGEVDAAGDIPGSGESGEAWRVVGGVAPGLYAWDGSAWTLDAAADGVVGFRLADLPDAGGGAIRKFDRDAKGRVSGTSDATTDDLPEGAENLYFTDARAIAAVGGISGGEILVADGMSAPPVMLTNEAEDDFLYSD